MIRSSAPRNGGWSVSAIFREARTLPALQHAVRAAHRDWWKDATSKTGDLYTCVWFHRPLFDGEPAPGWVVSIKQYSMAEQCAIGRAERDGFEVHWLPLSWTHRVFDLAAREHGLNCRVCGAAERADRYNATHVCGACEKAARRLGGVERMVAGKIMKEAKRLAREAGQETRA